MKRGGGCKFPTPFLIITTMDIYTYVATCNPYQAKSILHKYGYSAKNIKSENDLGVCLKQLVASEGEDAFIDVLESHPDKGVIIEKYVSENKKDDYKNQSGSCGCNHAMERHYMNFNGQNDNRQSSVTKETNVFILAAALMLAAAIIVKN
jgi:hypothetical protein